MAASSAQGLGADPAHGHHHMLHHAADAEPVALHDHGAMHPAAGDQAASGHDHGVMQHDAHQHDGHESHARMLSQPGYARTEAVYRVPDVVLTNQNGERVKLRELLLGPQPVMLNYIYTSCTAICPVLSASFAQTQQALGPEARDIRMVSISIDPEYDNPARLSEYAKRFRAEDGWQLLTGSLEDVITVQKAFDAYRGNKSSHIPLTFIRAGAGDRWIRLQGFASAGELVQEYRSLASSAAGAGRG
jgi:protein SCO1/2